MEIPYSVKPRPDTGLYNAKVGIWLFLASEVMLFGALFATYILLRVGAPEGTWPHGWLNVPLGTFNTVVLIASSITVVLAWASLKMNDFNKFKLFQGITLLLALTFVVVKAFEYHDKFTHYEVRLTSGEIVDGHLVSHTPEHVIIHPGPTPENPKPDNVTIPRGEIQRMVNYGPWFNTYMGIYFTLTGLHALHVIGGAVVLGYLWGPGRRMWFTDPERFTNRVEVTGLFWHFVDLVWIFLFPVLYLL